MREELDRLKKINEELLEVLRDIGYQKKDSKQEVDEKKLRDYV